MLEAFSLKILSESYDPQFGSQNFTQKLAIFKRYKAKGDKDLGLMKLELIWKKATGKQKLHSCMWGLTWYLIMIGFTH